MHRCWFWKKHDSYSDILELLGLYREDHEPKTNNEFVALLEKEINDGNPCLVEVTYDSIYYNSEYHTGNKNVHCILVNGIDEEKELVNLKDYLFAREFTKSFVKGNAEVFVDSKVKYQHLLEIWQESQTNKQGKVYIIKKHGSPQISDYRELIKYFLDNVEADEKVYDCLNDSGICLTSPEDIRKRLFNSINMMLDIVKRIFNKEYFYLKNMSYEYMENEIDEVIKNRLIYTTLMHKDIIRYKKISEASIEYMTQNDKKIYSILSKIFSEMSLEEKKECGENLALGKNVYCDSEGENAWAKYAVDGISSDSFHCWLSDYFSYEHWLVVDLGNKEYVSSFVIKHHPSKAKLVTRDFCIDGSDDMENWDRLFSVKDNTENISEIKINTVCYRYFRLYIKKANSIDENSARIFAFEIYA